MYPEIATKMRAEVLQHCGAHSMPTFDQIHQLAYSKLTPTSNSKKKT
jgi:hypothetical protein